MRTIRTAAAVILDRQGRMLVVRKRGTSVFMQPGGKIDAGETAEAALVRELEEELGLSIDPAGAKRLGLVSAPAAFEAETMVEAVLFRVETSATPRACAEIEEIAWVEAGDPGERPLAPLTRDRVLPLVRDLNRH